MECCEWARPLSGKGERELGIIPRGREREFINITDCELSSKPAVVEQDATGPGQPLAQSPEHGEIESHRCQRETIFSDSLRDALPIHPSRVQIGRSTFLETF